MSRRCAALLWAFLAGCGHGCHRPEPTASPTAASSVTPSANPSANGMDVVARGKAVLAALKTKDVSALRALVHPTKGVRLCPYGYIDTESSVVLQAAELGPALTDPTKRVFGSYDGSGMPIELTLGEYWAEFVWDAEFDTGKLVVDPKEAHGNTVLNHGEVYPKAPVVEFFLDGSDPDRDGMDWRALRLVFEPVSGTLHLVAIVHDQWTI